jgi:hypothetical protein
MRKFKLQRLKYEANQNLIEKNKVDTSHNNQKGKITKYLHFFNKKFLSQQVQELVDTTNFEAIQLPSALSKRERLFLVERDFNNCISNSVMSQAAIQR